jgi:hypothetical protein
MTLRRTLGRLAVAALVVCGTAACKDKGSPAQAKLEKRCEQLVKTCGDKDKKSDKLLTECKEAAKKQADAKCEDKATAAYDCYEVELCGAEKVWALDDFRVLADRHKKCVAERDALKDCAK